MLKDRKVKPLIYLWRKSVEPRWIDIYEASLRDHVGDEFAVITRPGRKRVLFEVACKSRKQARDLSKEFGGRIEKLPTNWVKRFSRKPKAKPLKIGRRLVIAHSPNERGATGFPYGLVIPSGAAFGTGNTRPRRCRCDFWSKSPAAGNRVGRWAILGRAAEFSL